MLDTTIQSQELCLKCGHDTVTVQDSRIVNNKRRRRRVCRTCKYRWFTIEIPEKTLDQHQALLQSINAAIAALEQARAALIELDTPNFD
jgi:transcriptional regulator NrdR family protein